MVRKVLLLILLLLCITSTVFAQEGKLYENKEYKFRLTYPQNWEPLILKKTKVDGIIVSFGSPDTLASVSVEVTKSARKRVEELSKEEIRQVVEESVNEFRTFLPDIKVNVNSYSIENFKEQKAIKITTTCPAQYFSSESTDTVYVLFRDSYKYEISFGGFIPGIEQYRKLLIESIESFEFVP
jgi:hypothetical protein